MLKGVKSFPSIHNDVSLIVGKNKMVQVFFFLLEVLQSLLVTTLIVCHIKASDPFPAQPDLMPLKIVEFRLF